MVATDPELVAAQSRAERPGPLPPWHQLKEGPWCWLEQPFPSSAGTGRGPRWRVSFRSCGISGTGRAGLHTRARGLLPPGPGPAMQGPKTSSGGEAAAAANLPAGVGVPGGLCAPQVPVLSLGPQECEQPRERMWCWGSRAGWQQGGKAWRPSLRRPCLQYRLTQRTA